MNSLRAAPYYEGRIRLTVRDASRNKDIPITITYPADSASGDNRPLVGTGTNSIPTFGVLVMGHGYQMPVTAYKSFATNICQNVGSYIVVLPETGTGLFPSHNDFALDMVAVSTFMQNEAKRQGSIWKGHIRNDNVYAGHSMGGGAAFLAAKQALQSGELEVTAVIGLAPAETNPSSSAAAAFVTCPTLIIAGGVDCVTPLAGTVKPIYANLASACKTLAVIPGASHCQFADANSTCNLGELNCKATITRDAQFARSWQYINLLLRRSDGVAAKIGDTDIQTTLRSIEAQDVSLSRTQACTGDTIRCVYSGNATNLLWLPDSVRGPTYSFVARSGTHRISLISTTCFGTTGIDTTVSVFDRPTVRIEGASELCPSDSIVLRAITNSTPGNMVTVRWSTGATADSILVRQPGIYSVRATSARGCGDASASHAVDVATTPNVRIRITGDTISCGELKPLDAQLTGDLDLVKDIRWNTGDTARRITITKLGAYALHATMRMRADVACNVYTDTASFTMRIVEPNIPEVTFRNDTLWSSQADTYSWMFDGTPIAGATEEYHVPQRSGLYAVETTRADEYGCPSRSKAVRVTLSNVDESDSYTSPLIVKPGIVHVYSARQGCSLSIYNSAGCVMHSMLVDAADQPVRIDTSVFPAGVYAVVADGAWLGNFIVVR